MATLAEATLAVARMCGEVVDGQATGGSATTVVDTGVVHPDDFWNGGTIWLLSGNNAGKSAVITDYATATKTWTFGTLTLLCAAGDLYSVSGAAFPRANLMAAVNQALRDLGQVEMEDLTSLTGISEQLEYTLPAGVSHVTRVMTGASPSYYVNQHWNEVNGKLRFAQGFTPAAGDGMLLFYNGTHAALSTDVGAINGLLPLELVYWSAALYALRQRFTQVGPGDTRLAAKMNEAAQRVEMLKQHSGRFTRGRDPRLSDW
jgi:hypothetical protein